jgi:hypothetical protein
MAIIPDEGTVRSRGPYFAMVPEWLLDTEVSDRAVRLYAVLNRHVGKNPDGWQLRRKTLAERLRCSEASLSRAMRELESVGALIVAPNHRDDGSRAANNYLLDPTSPQERGGPPSHQRLGVGSPVTRQLREPLHESPSTRERAARAAKHLEGEALLREAWEARKSPPVVANWPGATKIVGRFLDEGTPRGTLKAALLKVPNVSTGCINIALQNVRPDASTGSVRELRPYDIPVADQDRGRRDYVPMPADFKAKHLPDRSKFDANDS